MKVSVIIPTYNGAHKLDGILNALQKQSKQPDEIIVIVDGSTDNTAEVLEEYQKTISSLKVFYQDNKGRAAVRNAGASKATCELLVFFDDDMLPEPNCLEVHLEHHRQKPMTILTGAQIDQVDKSSTDIRKFRAWLTQKWSKQLIQTQGTALSKENIFITAANFSISKELFFRINGFDENLTDAEDFDLAVRAYSQGIRLYYDHNAFAWQFDPISGKNLIKRQRQYRRANEKLHLLKPELYKQFSYAEPVYPVGIKKIFFSFFATISWVNWLDGSKFKILIPRKMRYKIYDWIITSNGHFFPNKVEL